MTGLHRVVRRKVPGGRRGFVVALHPGADPMIAVREAGRRGPGLMITVSGLYTILAIREAERARREKLARRKARRRSE